jgi:site-specific DNA-methyltransferase (adenine-specific)
MEQVNRIIQGDCLNVMRGLPDGSVGMVLADLPYGTTQNAWDSVIPLPPLWAELRRVSRRDSAIVLTAQTPFDKILGASNVAELRYEFIWDKIQGTGHLNAKFAPMKSHENCLVFYRDRPTYNPQFEQGKAYRCRAGRGSSNYGKQSGAVTINNGERYPLSILTFPRDRDGLHPTQKPVALFEYLIRTYTNPGDTVLDPTCGSATTAIAAMNTGRSYICIEKDPDEFRKASERIAAHLAKPVQFNLLEATPSANPVTFEQTSLLTPVSQNAS